ncbi:MAG: hypothetical protein ACLFS1_07465 [Opitutales bacterium]
MDLYHSTDADGISILNPDTRQMLDLLESLDEPETREKEHPDVSLTHDPSGWSLSVYPGGTATFENWNEADEPPRYMRNLNRRDCLEMWLDLAKGRIDSLQTKPWQRDP